MKRSKVLIFTTTYNEAENIEGLLTQISQYVADADLLVIDDNSPDGTGEKLIQIQQRLPQLKVIHRAGKLGVGSAHKMAIRYAQENQYDCLVTMDADFSHDPKVIPQMLAQVGKFEYIVGSRFIEGGHLDYTGFRKFISFGANFLARWLLGITVRETTTSFRCFRRSLLDKIQIEQVEADGYSFFLECTFLICRHTNNILEIPIFFQDRRFGQSKISKVEIYRGFLTLFTLAMKRLKWKLLK